MKYKILNPGGNKTALVFANNYTNEEKKQINDKILRENPDVEQVGFLNKTNKKLEMAGGEFCVNATRCAIWECLEGKTGEMKIKVSGYNEEILGGITKDKKVYANLKIDTKLEEMIISNNLKEQFDGSFSKEINEILTSNSAIIRISGITFIIFDENISKKYIKNLKENEEETKQNLKKIMSNLKTTEKAVGIVLLEKDKIYPIIWVKTIDTLYYETACGSGSLATSIYKYVQTKVDKFDILQPSGYIIEVQLEVEFENIKNAVIMGYVEDL